MDASKAVLIDNDIDLSGTETCMANIYERKVCI